MCVYKENETNYVDLAAVSRIVFIGGHIDHIDSFQTCTIQNKPNQIKVVFEIILILVNINIMKNLILIQFLFQNFIINFKYFRFQHISSSQKFQNQINNNDFR